MSTSPLSKFFPPSRVTSGSQFLCGSCISRVSSIETVFEIGGMKKDAAFIVDVLPLAVPPTMIMLLLFSTQSQMTAMSSELYSARHHVNVETFEDFVGNIGGGVRYYSELPVGSVSAVLLAVHVIGLDTAEVAVGSCNFEHRIRIVSMDVYPGLSLGAGQNQRITKL